MPGPARLGPSCLIKQRDLEKKDGLPVWCFDKNNISQNHPKMALEHTLIRRSLISWQLENQLDLLSTTNERTNKSGLFKHQPNQAKPQAHGSLRCSS